MGRNRFCWLSWWTELALIEQAEMKTSRYAAGSLLTVADLPVAEVAAILAATDRIEGMSGSDRARILAGRRIALLFYESSTRTRTSFELAAKSLGAITTLVSDKSSSIEKGESLKDTGLTLRAMLVRLPGVNAGRGNSRIDAKTLAGVTVVITGDILHSRVARSNAMLLPKLGARVLLCGPPELLPEDALGLGSAGTTGGVEIERDFDRALKKAQVVMMLRIQRERLAGLELDLGDYVARYQLNEERLTACAPSALVMHAGPMIRGLEMTGE